MLSFKAPVTKLPRNRRMERCPREHCHGQLQECRETGEVSCLLCGRVTLAGEYRHPDLITKGLSYGRFQS